MTVSNPEKAGAFYSSDGSGDPGTWAAVKSGAGTAIVGSVQPVALYTSSDGSGNPGTWVPSNPSTFSGGASGAPSLIPNLAFWFASANPPTVPINGGQGYAVPYNPVGSNRFLIANPGAAMTLHNSTVFAVFNSYNFAAANQAILGGPFAAYGVRLNQNGQLTALKQSVSVFGVDPTILAVATWYQANVTYNDTTGAYAFRINEAATSSGSSVNAIANVTNSIGFDSSNNTGEFNGALPEVIVYSRVLTPAEIVSVEAYLHTKYGV